VTEIAGRKLWFNCSGAAAPTGRLRATQRPALSPTSARWFLHSCLRKRKHGRKHSERMGGYFLEPLHCQTNPIRTDNIRDPSPSPGWRILTPFPSTTALVHLRRLLLAYRCRFAVRADVLWREAFLGGMGADDFRMLAHARCQGHGSETGICLGLPLPQARPSCPFDGFTFPNASPHCS
jgi:hypothetical protein